MSEYWKSTPKYWCKFCKTYVRDTKLEKQQHDATPRHQGNIQRSLRTLHREHEREDRDKQRAKDEVARLNGIVSGGSGGVAPGGSRISSAGAIQPITAAPKQASADDRKRQMKQLADLGVEVPKEYRAEIAMVGQWETTGPPRRVGERSFKEEEDVKPGELSFGVRKRKHEGAEEVEEAGETVVRKGWGSTVRRYPGEEQGIEDVEALFKGGSASSNGAQPVAQSVAPVPGIKKEESESAEVGAGKPDIDVKLEENGSAELSSAVAGIVFKKRKAKVAKAS